MKEDDAKNLQMLRKYKKNKCVGVNNKYTINNKYLIYNKYFIYY